LLTSGYALVEQLLHWVAEQAIWISPARQVIELNIKRYGKATELPSHELLPRAASARKCMALSCVLYFPDGYGSV
jgi:hypothetical protein